MRLSWVIIFCTMFAACGSLPTDTRTLQGLSQVMVQNPVWSYPGREIEAAQLLSGQSGDQSYAFQARIHVSETELHMLAIDPLGRRAMEINWGQKGVHAKRAVWLPRAIKADDVLRHIILVYWPEQDVASLLLDDYAVVDDYLNQRRVVHNGKDVIVIQYETSRKNAWSETTKLQDNIRNSQLTIQSSEIANE